MSNDMRMEELRKSQEKDKWTSLAKPEKWCEEIVDMKLYGQVVDILDSTVKGSLKNLFEINWKQGWRE